MEIIAELGEQRIIEKMVLGYTHRVTLTNNQEDLCQMLYMSLMAHPAEDLKRMKQANELTSYIGGMIRNQISSRTSPFYYKIVRPSRTQEIDERTTHGED